MRTRNFTKTVLTVAGLLALGTFSNCAFAQSGQEQQGNPPAATQTTPKMHKHGEGIFAELNLTDDQKAQIKKIREDAKAKADALKADTTLSDADKKAKFREIRKTAMTESKKVLTAEQQAQLEQKMKERRARKSQGSPS